MLPNSVIQAHEATQVFLLFLNTAQQSSWKASNNIYRTSVKSHFLVRNLQLCCWSREAAFKVALCTERSHAAASQPVEPATCLLVGICLARQQSKGGRCSHSNSTRGSHNSDIKCEGAISIACSDYEHGFQSQNAYVHTLVLSATCWPGDLRQGTYRLCALVSPCVKQEQ